MIGHDLLLRDGTTESCHGGTGPGRYQIAAAATIDHMAAPDLFVVTGIMASGKSTIADQLARRYDRSVHVRGDVFRRMVVSGAAPMDPGAGAEAERQLRMRYRLAARTAAAYHAAGFTVVVQDTILGAHLPRFIDALGVDPVYLVVLAPRPDVVAERERQRDKTGYRAWTPELLDREFRSCTPHLGLWLDTSAMTVAESVDAIVARPAEALVRPRASAD